MFGDWLYWKALEVLEGLAILCQIVSRVPDEDFLATPDPQDVLLDIDFLPDLQLSTRAAAVAAVFVAK